MSRRMTIYEFAREVGVSTGTIYRALNGRSDINPGTRDLVLRRMRELGYRPSRAALALSTGKSRTIALWLSGLSSSYAIAVLQASWRPVNDAGYEMVVRDVMAPSVLDPDNGGLSDWPVDGVLLVDPGPIVAAYVRGPHRPRAAMVAMGRLVMDDLDAVEVDLRPGVQAAMQRLIDIGCRRIAYFVHAHYTEEPDETRHAIYRDAVLNAGREPEYILIKTRERGEAREAIRAYVRDRGAPDGIFCYNDDIALGAYRGLLDLGIRVPDDVSLIGCDGIEDTGYTERPLTTIQLPVAEMAAAGWRLLQRRIQEPDAPLETVRLTTRLLVRDSAAAPVDPQSTRLL